MNEDIGHVTYWARMYSLVAKMEAIKTRVIGMEAFNKFRFMQGDIQGYGESEFDAAENELLKISEELTKI